MRVIAMNDNWKWEREPGEDEVERQNKSEEVWDARKKGERIGKAFNGIVLYQNKKHMFWVSGRIK